MKKRFSLLMAIIFASQIWTAQAWANETVLTRLNTLTQSQFTADASITREDLCVVVAKVFYKTPGEPEALPFADASQLSEDSAPWLAALYADGLLFGVRAGDELYMLPDAPVSRQDALTLLGRVLGKTSSLTHAFADIDEIADYALPYISWFAEAAIVVGYPDGRFGPSNHMTADELATLVIRTVEYRERNETPVETYAGAGSRGFDDGSRASARFLLPYGVAVGSSGGLYVFDTFNNAIREIADDTVTTLAGRLRDLDDNRFPRGYLEDGALASALLNRPTAGAWTASGELFVCDSENNAVRVIADGEMRTIGQDVFQNPLALAADGDDVYVADTLNHCVRRISGDTITVVAGTPGKEGHDDELLCAPSGIAVADGVVYIADTGNHRICKLENDELSILAGFATDFDDDGEPLGGFANGPAAVAQFCLPMGLTVADGLLLVADSGNHMIRGVTASGSVITVAGSGEPGDQDGGALEAMLSHPMGVAYHNGSLFIADTGNNKIKRMPLRAAQY